MASSFDYLDDEALRRLLDQYKKSLAILEEKRASFDKGLLPTHISHEINDVTEKITAINEKLHGAPSVPASTPSVPPVPQTARRRGIPGPLRKSLQDTLERCYEFRNADSLSALFDDSRLVAFRSFLPNVSTTKDRVDLTISQYADVWTRDGENVLAILLDVLYQNYPEVDDRHDRVKELRDQLGQA
ncbi:MAG TPA: hypothetical protein VD886_10350 [Herpetosiphonaceae bacterium]|nr:hypothetical protein [Herpetosiphonaceae bacterium]